ncbi:hypothetical protein [Simplicispira psychrophila]|uniref:hypothetical protein n=1 Tax=Simplicispira psychrophila TaxID=80882 RepID=UPI00068F605F|nr:hypothetical protein [Simplicispira psychrophila]
MTHPSAPSTSSVPSAAAPALPTPTADQQVVLDRIAAQRERLRDRRARRAQQQVMQRAEPGLPPDASVALRAVVFAKQYPLAVAAVAGVAVVAGPKRLMRWAGLVLPLLLRLRTQR